MVDTKLNATEYKGQYMGPIIGTISFKMCIKHPSEDGICQAGVG